MRLSDIMGGANLAIYPIIALIAFMAAFLGIGFYVLSKRNQETFSKAKLMPLDDENPQTPRQPAPMHEAAESVLDGGGR